MNLESVAFFLSTAFHARSGRMAEPNAAGSADAAEQVSSSHLTDCQIEAERFGQLSEVKA